MLCRGRFVYFGYSFFNLGNSHFSASCQDQNGAKKKELMLHEDEGQAQMKMNEMSWTALLN